jgi:hypothetical protein
MSWPACLLHWLVLLHVQMQHVIAAVPAVQVHCCAADACCCTCHVHVAVLLVLLLPEQIAPAAAAVA